MPHFWTAAPPSATRLTFQPPFTLLRRKRQDGVEMVGHDEENGGMPALPLFVVVYRVEQGAG